MSELRKQNQVAQDGVNWPTRYGVVAGIEDMEIETIGANGKNFVRGIYTGSGAITLSNYDGFPTGSTIVDAQALVIHLKTGATSWVKTAAMT